MKTLNITKMLLCLAVTVIMTSSVWAVPVVDGNLGDDEYSHAVTGMYGRCYYDWYNGDFYVCLDWYNPDTQFPDLGDDYSLFTWTHVDDWRLKINPTYGILQEKVNGVWTNRPVVCAAGFHTSENDPDVEHPIWEFKLSSDQIGSGDVIIPHAPKNPGDSGDPGKNGGWDAHALGFGGGPAVTVP